jgi:hypothetical protein
LYDRMAEKVVYRFRMEAIKARFIGF